MASTFAPSVGYARSTGYPFIIIETTKENTLDFSPMCAVYSPLYGARYSEPGYPCNHPGEGAFHQPHHNRTAYRA